MRRDADIRHSLVPLRDHELQQLLGEVASGAGGLRCIEVVSPLGAGLSTFLSQLADAAATHGFETSLLQEARLGSRPISAWDGAPAHADRIDVAAARLRARLQERARTHPQLVIFDDADRLSHLGRAAASALLDAPPDADMVVVLAHHSTARTLDLTDRFAHLHRVVLEPLDPLHVARALCTLGAGTDLDDDEAMRIARACDGNLWLAVELARSGDVVPVSVVDWVRGTFGVADRGGQDLLLALAASPTPLSLDELAWIATQVEADATWLQDLRDSALVRSDESHATTAGPLVTDLLTTIAPAARRRWIDSLMSLLHESRVDDEDRDDHADHLVRAAHYASRAGERDRALKLTERVLATTDAATRLVARFQALEIRIDLVEYARATAARRAAIQAARVAGLPDEARRHLGLLVQEAERLHDDGLLAYALNELYWLDGGNPARSRLEHAAALAPTTNGWARRAAATLAYLRGDYEDAVNHDAAAIELASRTGDRHLEAMAVQKQALCMDLAGDPEAAAGRYLLASQLALAVGLARWAIHSELNAAELWDSMLDPTRAKQALMRARDVLQSHGQMHMEWEVLAFESLHHHRRGEFEVAEQLARRGLEVAVRMGVDDGARAIVTSALGYVLVDRVAERHVDQVLADLERQAAATDDRMLLLEQRLQRAQLALSRGRIGEAVRDALEVETLDDTTEAARLLLLTRIALHGGQAEAHAAVRAYTAAPTPSRIRLRQLAERVAGVLEQSSPQLQSVMLDAMADELDGARRTVDALRLRALAWLLDEQRHGPDLEPLRELEGTCRRLGLRADADQLARELVRLGGVGSSAGGRAIDGLTPREREIVDLLAGGLSNGEIAERLGIQPGSVTRRLTNAYRRTGTSSRLELLRWAERKRRDAERSDDRGE